MVEDLHEEQSGGGAVAESADVEGEEVSNTSALRDNIAKKKQNAYYYAHAHKANGPEVKNSSIEMLIIFNALLYYCHVTIGSCSLFLLLFHFSHRDNIYSGMVRLSLNY